LSLAIETEDNEEGGREIIIIQYQVRSTVIEICLRLISSQTLPSRLGMAWLMAHGCDLATQHRLAQLGDNLDKQEGLRKGAVGRRRVDLPCGEKRYESCCCSWELVRQRGSPSLIINNNNLSIISYYCINNNSFHVPSALKSTVIP